MIGGQVGDNFILEDIVVCIVVYGSWLMGQGKNFWVVVGCDVCFSGSMVVQLVCSILQSLGIIVIDFGLLIMLIVEMVVLEL